jgi:hypothetical protein
MAKNDKLLISRLFYVLAAIALLVGVLLRLYCGGGWFAGAGLFALFFLIFPLLATKGDEYQQKGKEEQREEEWRKHDKETPAS